MNNLYVVVVIYLGASLDITKAYSRSRSSSSGRGDCINRGGKGPFINDVGNWEGGGVKNWSKLPTDSKY